MKSLTQKQISELSVFIKNSSDAQAIKRAQTILLMNEEKKYAAPVSLLTGYGKTQAYTM